MTHEERRLRREWLLTAVLATALLAWLVFWQSARLWGDVLYDRMMLMHGFEPSDDIVLIAVDDRSLQQLGGWPLQRSRYTELLERLQLPEFRPKALGLDLLFLDPSEHDAGLAQAMRRTPTILPIEFGAGQSRHKATLPAGELAQAARLSHINVSFDADGVIRGFHTFEKPFFHFALALHALSDRSHATLIEAQLRPGYRRFRMVDPSVGFPVIALADALSPNFPLSLLKDKHVLVGVTAPSLGDRYPTIYSGDFGGTPGVAILASILNASLNNELIETIGSLGVFTANWLAVALILLSLIAFKPRTALLFSVALSLLALGLSYLLLTRGNFWLNPVPLILVAALIQPFWAWRRLEAMTGMISYRAKALRQFQPEERANPNRADTSREVVLKYAKLLDHAVDSARHELQFLSAVIEEMPDAVAIYGADDRLLLSNLKMHSLVGKPALEHNSPLQDLVARWHLPAHFFSDLANPVPADALPVRPSQDPQASQRNVFQVNTHQGLRDIYLKNAAIAAPMGESLQLLIFMDITELRQYQTQRDRALQFLSHDMRTPLASILSLTRPGAATSQGEMPRDKVEHHARALLGMMDDFILTVNAEAPRYELRAELLDNLINDAIDLCNDLAQAKGISIVDDGAEAPVFLNANARLLVRALLNLLFNAIKFSPPNSAIRLQCQTLSVDNQAMVRIAIRNPIDPQEAEQEVAGFGLGLHFVDTVIARHQGTIERHLPPKGDAEVSILLPVLSD